MAESALPTALLVDLRLPAQSIDGFELNQKTELVPFSGVVAF